MVIPPPAQSTESDRAWTALSWLQEPARSRRQIQCNLGDAVLESRYKDSCSEMGQDEGLCAKEGFVLISN